MVANVISSERGARGTKRPKKTHVKFKYPEIRCNYQRKCVYACFADDDGKPDAQNVC